MENKVLPNLDSTLVSKLKDESNSSDNNSVSALALAASAASAANAASVANAANTASTTNSGLSSNPNSLSGSFPFYNFRQYDNDHSALASIAANQYNTGRFGLEDLRHYSMLPQLQNPMLNPSYLINQTSSADQQSLESLSHMVLFTQMANNLNMQNNAANDSSVTSTGAPYTGTGFDPNSIFSAAASDPHHLMYNPLPNLAQQAPQFSNFPGLLLNPNLGSAGESNLNSSSLIDQASSIYPMVNMDYFFPNQLNTLQEFPFFHHDLQYQVAKNSEIFKRNLTSDSLNTTSSDNSSNNNSSNTNTSSALGISPEQLYLNNMKKKFEWLVVEGGDIPNSPDADAQKKFKKMHCSYCREHNPSCAWASPRLRKVDMEIAIDHDKSPLHKNYRGSSDNEKITWDSINPIANFSKELDSRKRSMDMLDYDSKSSGETTTKRQKTKFTPEWLEAEGPLRYSNQQLASGKDLSKEKRKYKLLRCKLCAKYLPDSQWASMRPRKHEIQVFVEHERSCNHRKAIENSKKSLQK